jgi:hypothetical protein
MATPTKLQVNGGNLFVIALKQYGDATQWNFLAQNNWPSIRGTNGLIDYVLQPGAATLTVPKLPQNAGSGGVIVAP